MTNRGTNSTSSFSRGNNIPATAVPHGFNFWIPVTNAGSLSWLYDYHRDNNDDNLPTLEAFAASHEPSPWMGERQTFQVMPSGAAGTPDTSRDARALPFRHSNEVTSPHHYAVEFENGIETEIAPTDHAAMFRFKFPDGDANLVFDNVNDDASLTIDQENGVVTGYSDVTQRALRRRGADVRLREVRQADHGERHERSRARGYAKFDAGADKTVTMWIATSLISVDQARKNLELEIAPADTFDAVRERAQAQWDDKLDVIEVEGATEDQLTTLYSNLYRLFLYPELRAREHRHARGAGLAARGAVDRRPDDTDHAAARSPTARSTSTTASGTPTGRPGRPTRCSRRTPPASSSTASSSSTATAAGSRAGPRRATRT